MKKETQAQQVNRKAVLLKKKVCALLGWTEMEYAEFMYNGGRIYLLHYTDGDTFFCDQIERSAIFWNWWKNHWQLRDEAFVNNDQIGYLHRENLKLLYLHTHDARILATEIRPDSCVLSNSYANMMGELIKKEVAHE